MFYLNSLVLGEHERAIEQCVAKKNLSEAQLVSFAIRRRSSLIVPTSGKTLLSLSYAHGLTLPSRGPVERSVSRKKSLNIGNQIKNSILRIISAEYGDWIDAGYTQEYSMHIRKPYYERIDRFSNATVDQTRAAIGV